MVETKVKPGMILIAIILILYSSAVTTVSVSDCVTNPTSKVSVVIDVVGVPGPEGPNGDQGPRAHGYPGDTSQCEKIREVEQTEQIPSELNDLINSTFTKCGIYSLNWRRVYIHRYHSGNNLSRWSSSGHQQHIEQESMWKNCECWLFLSELYK